MSLVRKMHRANARKTSSEWPVRERPYRDSKRSKRGMVTGYETLHPTNGWQRIGAKRLRAQNRLRALAEYLAAKRPQRSTNPIGHGEG